MKEFMERNKNFRSKLNLFSLLYLPNKGHKTKKLNIVSFLSISERHFLQVPMHITFSNRSGSKVLIRHSQSVPPSHTHLIEELWMNDLRINN